MARTTGAPDYANPACWIREPLHATASLRTADVFYLHPTTYAGPAFNQRLDTPQPDAGSTVIARHVAAFDATCRVFVPRYRQVSLRGFREPGPDSARAYECAYADVLAAFRHYLRDRGGGRSFVLAGHSQGALHAARLLRDVVEADGLERSLIAAYLVGIGLSEGLFGTRLRRVLPCDRPDQTGCVVSWNSFLNSADSDPSVFLERTACRDREHTAGWAPGSPICVNPISFDKARPAVDAADNPGSLTSRDPPTLEPGLAGAEDRDGVAWITLTPEAGTFFPPLPGGNLHMHDLDLFHASLSADVARRIRANAGASR